MKIGNYMAGIFLAIQDMHPEQRWLYPLVRMHHNLIYDMSNLYRPLSFYSLGGVYIFPCTRAVGRDTYS